MKGQEKIMNTKQLTLSSKPSKDLIDDLLAACILDLLL